LGKEKNGRQKAVRFRMAFHSSPAWWTSVEFFLLWNRENPG